MEQFHRQYPYSSFTSDDIDSRYSNSRIGSNARVLSDLGLLEILNEETVGSNRYRYLEDDLDPGRDLAEQAYRFRIITVLEELGDESVIVAEEFGKGLLEYKNGSLKDWYSSQSIRFLADLSIINSARDPKPAADLHDIKFLEERTDEWIRISESLLESGELPQEHRLEKERFLDID